MELLILRCWMCRSDGCRGQGSGREVCDRFKACVGLRRHMHAHPAVVSACENVYAYEFNDFGGERR